MTSMKRILCVHPSSELYGSDRVFIQSIRALRDASPDAEVEVVLPVHGPLYEILVNLGCKVKVKDFFVLRRGEKFKGAMKSISAPYRAIRLAASLRDYDMVYLSTTVTVDYLLAGSFHRVASYVHVHELPEGFAQLVISALLQISHAQLIFISGAVRNAFPRALQDKGIVIWNGCRDVGNLIPLQENKKLKILLIGRFNSWKGQELLIESLLLLDKSMLDSIEVRLVGSSFSGQEHFIERVKDLLDVNSLSSVVKIFDFLQDPTEHYDWSDVVVVPSIKPEPFGLVAIEAMSRGRPVIAANHGGLTEIVLDNETGLLFTPGDPESLKNSIAEVFLDFHKIVRFGTLARKRYDSYFREDVYMNAFSKVVLKHG